MYIEVLWGCYHLYWTADVQITSDYLQRLVAGNTSCCCKRCLHSRCDTLQQMSADYQQSFMLLIAEYAAPAARPVVLSSKPSNGTTATGKSGSSPDRLQVQPFGSKMLQEELRLLTEELVSCKVQLAQTESEKMELANDRNVMQSVIDGLVIKLQNTQNELEELKHLRAAVSREADAEPGISGKLPKPWTLFGRAKE